jgi:hypothetical protein
MNAGPGKGSTVIPLNRDRSIHLDGQHLHHFTCHLPNQILYWNTLFVSALPAADGHDFLRYHRLRRSVPGHSPLLCHPLYISICDITSLPPQIHAFLYPSTISKRIFGLLDIKGRPCSLHPPDSRPSRSIRIHSIQHLATPFHDTHPITIQILHISILLVADPQALAGVWSNRLCPSCSNSHWRNAPRPDIYCTVVFHLLRCRRPSLQYHDLH